MDEHLAIAVKPSGQLTVPGRTADPQGCLHAQVQRRFADARVVHRLDMATSGLVIFARGAAAQRALNHAFAAREVDKRYIAVVRGHVCDDEGVIDLPLQADWPNRPRQQVSLAHGKPARTGYRVISRDSVARRSRLELRPETGRSHQLRVHLLALGHPILGDALYAPSTVSAETPRLLLHACGLAFAHPATGVRFQVTDVPPF